MRIAPVDDSLTITSGEAARNGESIDRAWTFQRVSGGPGLAGTWRSETERSRSAPLIEFDSDPYGVLVFKSATEGMVCVVILDGKDYPCFAASKSGSTRAMTMTETGILKESVKQDGEQVAESTYTVSPDGRSMIQRTEAASGRSLTTVYHRQ